MPRSTQWVVFTKWPQPGRVKTRLCPPLTHEQAAHLHAGLTLATIRNLQAAKPASDGLVVAYTPAESLERFKKLLNNAGFSPDELAWTDQGRGDLGQRLSTVHQTFSTSLFFGADTPDLPADHLAAAAELLDHQDVVLGPTGDGGYWCLGLAESVDAQALLTDVPWSSGNEFEATRQRAKALGYRVGLAPAWNDIDRFNDLRAFWQRRHDTAAGQWLGTYLLHGQHHLDDLLEDHLA